MRILRTEKQRENLAKFFWDMAKVALTFFVIAPSKPRRWDWAKLLLD
ncbi:MAG: hypothetical protein HYZ50_26560 [Deltaproteobacteria bacterium]|nr:hypothetical protein [Deltaproteobacteria bacterium]